LKKTLTYILLFFTLHVGAQQKQKTEPPTTRILFIFDASQSMYGTWGKNKKISIARKYLIQLIDSLENTDNLQMALRVYGHQSPVPPQDCSDTKLEIPFSNGNASKIRQKLRYIIPKGTTPIAHSLELAANDFPPCENCRNIIILITDGIEACDGDPCQASLDLQKKGIALKPFVIGIGIDPNFGDTFNCVGDFYNTTTEERFEKALNVVISRALNSTTAQVNLLDSYGNPTETNVNLSFFNHVSGNIKYNFIHTINYMGNPDTLIIDPLITYDLVVNTLPPIRKDSIKLSEGKHNMIGLYAPQGYLNISCPGSNQYRDLEIIVRKDDDPQILNVHRNEQTEKYLTGEYDLDILTIPRIKLENIKIEQSKTTKIAIPKPGIANLSFPSPGFGSLYKETSDTLEWVHNLNVNLLHQNLILQPGSYRIIFRPKNSKQVMSTVIKKFNIKPGLSNSITVY